MTPEITPAWVRERLGLPPGSDARVERIGEEFGLASTVLRVHMRGPTGPASVVVKTWPADTTVGDREVRVLRAAGDRLAGITPALLHAEHDEPGARFVMVLDDVVGADQGDHLRPVDGDDAVALASTVGRMHAATWAWSDEPAEVVPPAPWLDLDPAWFTPRRDEFIRRFPDRLGEAGRALLDGIEDAHAWAVSRLAAARPILLHDDLHLDNVLFDRRRGHAILLDWARASFGPAALDLAELLVGSIAPAACRTAQTAYAESLHGNGVPASDVDAVVDSLDAATVITFVRSTCGVAPWQPASPRAAALLHALIARADHAASTRLATSTDLAAILSGRPEPTPVSELGRATPAPRRR